MMFRKWMKFWWSAMLCFDRKWGLILVTSKARLGCFCAWTESWKWPKVNFWGDEWRWLLLVWRVASKVWNHSARFRFGSWWVLENASERGFGWSAAIGFLMTGKMVFLFAVLCCFVVRPCLATLEFSFDSLFSKCQSKVHEWNLSAVWAAATPWQKVRKPCYWMLLEVRQCWFFERLDRKVVMPSKVNAVFWWVIFFFLCCNVFVAAISV